MNLHEHTFVKGFSKVVRCAAKERGNKAKKAVVIKVLGNSNPLWCFRSMLEGGGGSVV